jgi:hypothetical protein
MDEHELDEVGRQGAEARWCALRLAQASRNTDAKLRIIIIVQPKY